MSDKKVEIVYPSYTKKAVTFTIDDGNVAMDVKLLSILRPVGIRGTFNLCSERLNQYSPDFFRELYRGYEIANHCKYHPLASHDGCEYKIADEPFNEATADPACIYPVPDSNGMYYVIRPNGWRIMTFTENYIRFVEDGLSELRAVFGDDAVKDYVWPFCEQDNEAIKSRIRELHRSCRKTGCTLDTTGFAIPADKYAWSYNANHQNLLEVMAEYEAYADDGELKFFAFGVHSIDFERDGKWGDLAEFAAKYGNRPKDYWYATVGEVFDYEAAVSMLRITDDYIYNPTAIPVYVKINGEGRVISPLGVCNY